MPDVVLPVLDEAAAIGDVLASIPLGWTPIVVDNGSTDSSVEIGRAAGARVVVEPRRGFGAACFAGLIAARADMNRGLERAGSKGCDERSHAEPSHRRDVGPVIDAVWGELVPPAVARNERDAHPCDRADCDRGGRGAPLRIDHELGRVVEERVEP